MLEFTLCVVLGDGALLGAVAAGRPHSTQLTRCTLLSLTACRKCMAASVCWAKRERGKTTGAQRGGAVAGSNRVDIALAGSEREVTAVCDKDSGDKSEAADSTIILDAPLWHHWPSGARSCAARLTAANCCKTQPMWSLVVRAMQPAATNKVLSHALTRRLWRCRIDMVPAPGKHLLHACRRVSVAPQT